MDFGYIKEGNEYVLYSKGNEILRTERLAIAFSVNKDNRIKYTLHKHGMPKFVKTWCTVFINKMKENGHHDLASEMKYVVSPNIPVEEINKMIDLTGYLPECIKGIIDE